MEELAALVRLVPRVLRAPWDLRDRLAPREQLAAADLLANPVEPEPVVPPG